MINLKVVSALDLRRCYYGQQENWILRSNDILDYQNLKIYLEESSKIELVSLQDRLLHVEKTIEKYNRMGKEAKVYITPGYSDELISKADTKVFGRDLLLWNPTTERWIRYSRIMDLNPFEIKHLLSHTDPKGDNALCQIRDISESNVGRIYDAICMYEEQIFRQAIETKSNSADLFYLNEQEKKEIVKDTLKDIVLYLLDNTKEELVW